MMLFFLGIALAFIYTSGRALSKTCTATELLKPTNISSSCAIYDFTCVTMLTFLLYIIIFIAQMYCFIGLYMCMSALYHTLFEIGPSISKALSSAMNTQKSCPLSDITCNLFHPRRILWMLAI